mgnify:CR=1 FL=1
MYDSGMNKTKRTYRVEYHLSNSYGPDDWGMSPKGYTNLEYAMRVAEGMVTALIRIGVLKTRVLDNKGTVLATFTRP